MFVSAYSIIDVRSVFRAEPVCIVLSKASRRSLSYDSKVTKERISGVSVASRVCYHHESDVRNFRAGIYEGRTAMEIESVVAITEGNNATIRQQENHDKLIFSSSFLALPHPHPRPTLSPSSLAVLFSNNRRRNGGIIGLSVSLGSYMGARTRKRKRWGKVTGEKGTRDPRCRSS